MTILHEHSRVEKLFLMTMQNLDLMFDSAQALQIAADDNIEVDNYDAVPFVAAVQRGNRRATSLSMAWETT